MNRPEILSPAGDLEKLKYAVKYGADAVYLAGRQFGMRAAAGNFSLEELEEGVAFAHENGVKVYVTVNVMPRNPELDTLPEYLLALERIGVDALIVADVGVVRIAKRTVPNLPIHISTQTSIVNYEAANFWAELGAERVVLARELSLEEIKTIRENTPPELELECFVHGAMCISYSGRCLISNYLTGRDANHGACAQPCRWKYSLMEEKRPGEYFPVVEDDKGTYLYNSKDMCMIEHIPELIRAGITSFKIEGRAKTAFYTAIITGAYRRGVDAYYEQGEPDSFTLPQEILDESNKVSHRNYYTGFYFGRDPEGQYYEDSQYIREWELTGFVAECDEEGNAAFLIRNRFYKGDVLELVQPRKPIYRFTVEQMLDDEGNELDVARHAMMRVHMKFPFAVDPYAILRRETAQKG